MLKIRLQRTGKRNAPAYRLIVAEHSDPVKGRFVEIVGSYIPTKHNRLLTLKTERIQHWLSVGAIPSQTVARLCIAEGVKEAKKYIKNRIMKPSNAEIKAAEEAKKKEEEAKAAKEAAKAEAEAAKKAAEEAANQPEETAPAEEVTA